MLRVVRVVPRTLPAALPCAWTKTLAAQLHIHASAISASSQDNNGTKRALYERTWTLSGTTALEKLKLRVPGVTFISLDAAAAAVDNSNDAVGQDDDVVATLRVTSDSSAALERIAVAAGGPKRLAVTFANPSVHLWRRDATLPSHGTMRTEVLLHSSTTKDDSDGSLRSLAVSGNGLVIVDDDRVFALETPDTVLSLAAAHSSRLFIQAKRDVRVDSLKIASAQRSRIDVHAPSVEVQTKISIASAGDARVSVHARGHVRAPALNIAAAGQSPAAAVHGDSITLDDLRCAVAGDGRIVIASARSGDSVSCATQKLAVCGTGAIDCASVATADAAIAVAGDGRVTVDARDVLQVAAFGNARVTYPTAPPRTIRASEHSTCGPSRVARMTETERCEWLNTHARESEAHEELRQTLPTRTSALDPAQCAPLTTGSWLEHTKLGRWMKRFS